MDRALPSGGRGRGFDTLLAYVEPEKIYEMGGYSPTYVWVDEIDSFEKNTKQVVSSGWTQTTSQDWLNSYMSGAKPQARQAQRAELLRAIREDPSMGSRETKQFVAYLKVVDGKDKKRVTTARMFEDAIDMDMLTGVSLESRQDTRFGQPHGAKKIEGLRDLPDNEWVHVIIKPTKPNDLGILGLRRAGAMLQVHEVTSGARAKSENPGVDRVVILPA